VLSPRPAGLDADRAFRVFTTNPGEPAMGLINIQPGAIRDWDDLVNAIELLLNDGLREIASSAGSQDNAIFFHLDDDEVPGIDDDIAIVIMGEREFRKLYK
jgi:hypothetical protein